MVRFGVALLCGFVFAIGLGISGMTDANVVLAFLNVAGDWDFRLALVMAGALCVYMPAYLLYKKSNKPLLAKQSDLPPNRPLDARLVIGAIVFGAGWGASGICPGPGFVAAISGSPKLLVFLLALAVGILSKRFLIQD